MPTPGCIAAARVRPCTLAAYRGYVNNHVAPALGHPRLDKLQPEHLEPFYRERAQQGLSPTTVLQMHQILSRALKIAMRRGRVPRNVAAWSMALGTESVNASASCPQKNGAAPSSTTP